MIVCAGNNEHFSFATPMGVGLVEMSINLTRLCLMDPPEYLLFVGTAGSYGEAKIFDIVESKTAANIELCFLQKKCYTPLDNVITTNTQTTKEIIVNSSNYITTNKELAKNFLKFNIGLENMEFFAFLRVAKEFDIPAGGLFCVTNYTDENAHTDFIKNHQKAKELLEKYVQRMKK
ncbi:Purine nucleoside phosphorylase [hydrothermal vent metagenome]|uniref:Purine nucleoside phosphorylase n=1 Tax=hydrothermal vent metagenome TaxID=652676 RepID=A0A1W1BCG4_9ZZZZ